MMIIFYFYHCIIIFNVMCQKMISHINLQTPSDIQMSFICHDFCHCGQPCIDCIWHFKLNSVSYPPFRIFTILCGTAISMQ